MSDSWVPKPEEQTAHLRRAPAALLAHGEPTTVLTESTPFAVAALKELLAVLTDSPPAALLHQ